MAKRKAKQTPVTPGAEAAPESVAAATAQQIEVAQMQAARRLQTQHAVLKTRFAEVEVDRTILQAENQQLIQQLRSAKTTIEKLTAEVARLTPKEKPDTEPAPSED